ncbi:MAG: uroporphyrinogen decarboxylase family protein [Kiritimatiellae bacterium]|nr:uroporphyrinogen decarboxylase family protein [Kiritimatiellia bacterium]
MTSRSRVHAALRKQPVDRVPVFMWFHPVMTRRLASLLEIPPASVSQAFGDDIAQTWVNNNQAMEGIVHAHDGEGHTDPWGIRWVKHGAFNQIERTPLENCANETELDRYAFPSDRVEELLAPMSTLAARVGDDRFLGCDVSPCVLEMYGRLRGMEPSLLDMADKPDTAARMLARCADFAAELAALACRRYRLDWLWTGDDVAGQQGMLISPSQWRAMVKPNLARVVKTGRDAGLHVAYHSCGALRPIIGDLAEIGVTVLNPLQCNCPGMDPLELKREFGGRLAFMGGVDTQGLLPHASADEVRCATSRLIEGMTADGGGYILAASHTVPPETPDTNIFAMYEAAGICREEIFDRAADIRRRAG